MVLLNHLRYVVENDCTGETAAFESYDWLEAREQAVAFALDQRSKSDAEKDFQGIKLSLEYSEQGRKGMKFRHEILTGERMHSADIVLALHRESEILTRCGKEFEITQGLMDNKTFLAVNHRYATLYYFTARLDD